MDKIKKILNLKNSDLLKYAILYKKMFKLLNNKKKPIINIKQPIINNNKFNIFKSKNFRYWTSLSIIVILLSIIIAISILTLLEIIKLNDNNAHVNNNPYVNIDLKSINSNQNEIDFKINYFSHQNKNISLNNFFTDYDSDTSDKILNIILVKQDNKQVSFSMGLYITGMYNYMGKNQPQISDLIYGNQNTYIQSISSSDSNLDSYMIKAINLSQNSNYIFEAYMLNTKTGINYPYSKYKISSKYNKMISTKTDYSLDFSYTSNSTLTNASLLLNKFETFGNYIEKIPDSYYLCVTFYKKPGGSTGYNDNQYPFGIVYYGSQDSPPSVNKNFGPNIKLAYDPTTQYVSSKANVVNIDFSSSANWTNLGDKIIYTMYAYLISWNKNDAIMIAQISGGT